MPMLSGNTLFEAEDAASLASLASLDPVSQVITTSDRKGYVTETSTSPREIRTVMCCDRHRYLNYVSTCNDQQQGIFPIRLLQSSSPPMFIMLHSPHANLVPHES
jgi:hypothetical protein